MSAEPWLIRNIENSKALSPPSSLVTMEYIAQRTHDEYLNEKGTYRQDSLDEKAYGNGS